MCLLLLLSACVIGCGIGKPLFEALNTVTFAEQGGKTTLTLQTHVVKSTVEAAPYSRGDGSGLDAKPRTPRGEWFTHLLMFD
jgi:hypothetical protein